MSYGRAEERSCEETPHPVAGAPVLSAWGGKTFLLLATRLWMGCGRGASPQARS